MCVCVGGWVYVCADLAELRAMDPAVREYAAGLQAILENRVIYLRPPHTPSHRPEQLEFHFSFEGQWDQQSFVRLQWHSHDANGKCQIRRGGDHVEDDTEVLHGDRDDAIHNLIQLCRNTVASFIAGGCDSR